MSVHPVLSATTVSSTAAPLPSTEEDNLPEGIRNSEQLSYEERHKNLVDANTRYIYDQMMRSIQQSTQEMIRQAREHQKEDEENSR